MKFCSLTRKMDPNGPWTSLGFTRGFLLPSLSVSPLLLFSPWPCCQTGSSVSSPIADMKFPPCPGLRFGVNCHWMYRTERCIFSCLCVPDTSMCVPDTSMCVPDSRSRCRPTASVVVSQRPGVSVCTAEAANIVRRPRNSYLNPYLHRCTIRDQFLLDILPYCGQCAGSP